MNQPVVSSGSSILNLVISSYSNDIIILSGYLSPPTRMPPILGLHYLLKYHNIVLHLALLNIIIIDLN